MKMHSFERLPIGFLAPCVVGLCWLAGSSLLWASAVSGSPITAASLLQDEEPAENDLETDSATTGVTPALEAGIASVLAEGAAERLQPQEVLGLYSACMLEYGSLEPLTDHLKKEAKAIAADASPGELQKRRGLLRMRAQLFWRYGRLKDARGIFKELAKEDSDLDARLNLARLLDADGNTKVAVESYRALLPLVKGVERERLHIRIALMELESEGNSDGEPSPPVGEVLDGAPGVEAVVPMDPLSTMASEEGRSGELRNRAAVVLALLGKPEAAIQIYKAEGKPKAQLLGELRLAEWGMAAKNSKVAQEAAWRAVGLATVARERRYALTLLAEAHRLDQSLDVLLARFESEAVSLAPEARGLWIDILRETQKYDDAIRLVQGERAEGGFSDAEQLELFEMYREANRDADLVAAYQARMQTEPANVAWREGLSRYFLESGQRESALEVWQGWLASESGGQELMGADALMALGLDELAEQVANQAVARADDGSQTSVRSNPESALLFLFDLYKDRGRLEEARAVLQRLDERSAPDAPVRVQLGDAYERLGDKRQAVTVLTGLVGARPEGEAGEDVEMRLAWLQSEVGEEIVALAQWRALWERVNSVARRRYVEDRMMTVASRLGNLADVAVELEEKLFAGSANERESGLLVRLYTKVGDSVSAAEVIEEFMRHSGGSEIQTLTEKARVYLACTDYYHYEKAVKRLIQLDPAGEPDYLRQLAMSQLERGKPNEAREVLMRLSNLESDDSSSAEFEAGVLALSGMREEAISAYRKGLANHSDRIDAYILMAGLMKELNQIDQAVGMFQFLAENAERDDLFTIAIDGILNMLVDAPPRPKTVQWARRVTMERLAGRHDKPYLYQLLSDLSSESNNHDDHLLALENALASAGPRRGSVLRELMELTIEKRRSFNSPGWPGDEKKHLAMGRRLVGLAEAVPPQVYLDLGTAFLKAKDARAAERTFALTRSLPDGAMYQRQAAASFEKEGFVRRSLDMYEAVLATLPSDVPLLAKVGEVHENLGDDDRASDLYARCMDLLMRRRPLSVDTAEEDSDAPFWMRNRNVDDFSQNYGRVLNGLLATIDGEPELLAILDKQAGLFDSELPLALEKSVEMGIQFAESQKANSGPNSGTKKDEEWFAKLQRHPRLLRRSELYRRVALAWGRTDLADAMDQRILNAFPKDDDLLETIVRERLNWGQVGSAKNMIDSSDRDDGARRALLVKVGEVVESTGSTPIPLAEAVRQVLPLISENRLEEVSAVVRRADLAKVEDEEIGLIDVLFNAARYLEDDDLILKIGRDWMRLKMGGNRSYELEQIFQKVGGALSKENELALARYLVSRVFEDPEKNAALVTMLPTLAKRSTEPLVSTEQVLELLDGYGARYAWGLEPVIALLPSEARAGAVRGVWGKLEKTQRAPLLLNLVTEIDEEFGEEFASFIKDGFAESLGDAEDYMEYSVGELVDVKGNDQLVLDLVEVLQDGGWERVKSLPAIRAMRMQTLKVEGAEEVAAQAWIALSQEDDYYARQALTKMGKAFLPEALPAILVALEETKQEDGDSEGYQLSLLTLLRSAGEEHRDAYVQALEGALAAYPDEVEILEEAADHYARNGELVKGALTLEHLIPQLDDEKVKKRKWRTIIRNWEKMRHPEKVLAAKRNLNKLEGGGEEEDPMAGMIMIGGGAFMMAGAEEEPEKGLPKTIKDLKADLEEGRVEDASRILRRIWRGFKVGEPKANRFGFSFYSSPMARLKWPEEKTEEDENPSLGGLVAFLDRQQKRKEDKDKEGEGDEPTAFEHMAEHDALVAELERFLRTQTPQQLDRLQDLLKGMLLARHRQMGEEASLADLLEKVRTGRAGKADKILLLASLDRSEDGLPEAARPVLADLPRTVAPRDAAQIKRLARVYARGDLTESSLRLFRWCSTQAETSSYYYSFGGDGGTTVSVSELVQEAKELFEGEERIRMIEDVLRFADPGDRPWERNQFEKLVVETWAEVLPPADAMERARIICDASIDLSKGMRREVALGAAALYGKVGELDSAALALEVSLAKLDPKRVTQSGERWYRVDPETPGRLGDEDVELLFPAPEGETPGASGEWLRLAGEKLSLWSSEDRLHKASAMRALTWIGVQLYNLGDTDSALAVLGGLGEPDLYTPSQQLWWVDALRMMGQDEQALTMERGLLGRGLLHPERVPAVIASIAELEGPEKALEAFRPLQDNTRHPELVDLMIQLGTDLGDTAWSQRWTDAKAAAAEATAGIEEMDRIAKEKKEAESRK